MAKKPLTIQALGLIVPILNDHIAAAQPIAKSENGWALIRAMTVAICDELRGKDLLEDIDLDNLHACIRAGVVFVNPDGSVVPRPKH